MNKIIIKSTDWRGSTYVITPDDGLGDYVDIQGNLIPKLYDNDENPINEDVAEMDKCITTEGWNPERFAELWKKLYKGDDFYVEN